MDFLGENEKNDLKLFCIYYIIYFHNIRDDYRRSQDIKKCQERK